MRRRRRRRRKRVSRSGSRCGVVVSRRSHRARQDDRHRVYTGRHPTPGSLGRGGEPSRGGGEGTHVTREASAQCATRRRTHRQNGGTRPASPATTVHLTTRRRAGQAPRRDQTYSGAVNRLRSSRISIVDGHDDRNVYSPRLIAERAQGDLAGSRACHRPGNCLRRSPRARNRRPALDRETIVPLRGDLGT